MSEKTSYQAFKKNVVKFNDRIDRIENAMIAGMFDVSYCSDGVETWIEIKSPREPARPTTRLFGSNHKLSQDQMNWCLRQINAGGRAAVLIETDKRWLLIDGVHADKINELTIRELIELSRFHSEKPMRELSWIGLKEAINK